LQDGFYYDTIATKNVAMVRIRVPSGPAGDGGIIMASIMIQNKRHKTETKKRTGGMGTWVKTK
jgi:hypothetical protein